MLCSKIFSSIFMAASDCKWPQVTASSKIKIQPRYKLSEGLDYVPTACNSDILTYTMMNRVEAPKMKPQNQTLYFSMFQPKKWARAKVEFEAVDVFILTNLFSFRLWTTHPLTEIVAARQFTYGSQFSIQCFLFQVWWHFSCCVRRIKTCKNISRFTEAYGSLQGGAHSNYEWT